MKFKFIHSKKGYGKTKYIIEDIEKNQEDNIIIFVPSHNTFSVENRLVNYFGEKIFSRIEIMDFKKLTSRILNKYKGFKTQRISDVGKNLLINRIIRNSSKELCYFKESKQMNFSDDILSTLIDFKSFNIKSFDIEKILEDLDKGSILYKKLKDFHFINNKYENYLEEKYLDPLDDMVITNSIISNDEEIFKGYKFYIDGFEIFTYHQYEFLKIILHRAREINLSLTLDEKSNNLIYTHTKNIKDKILKILFDKGCFDVESIFLNHDFKNCELKHLDENYLEYKYSPYEKSCENIFINKCLNNFHESYELCKNIRKLVIERGYRYSEIGVLCRDIDSYENFIKVSFDEFNIPYFIDKKNEIRSSIFVVFLTSIFEMFNYNFSYVSLFKYIKSGLIDINEDEIFELENFSIENGITGYKWIRKFTEDIRVKYSMENKFEDLDIENLENIRSKIINPLVKLFSSVSKDNSVNYFIIKIYEFLEENSVLEKIHNICEDFINQGNLLYRDEIIQTVNSIFNIFDEINSVFKDEIMSFSEFGEILLNSFSKLEISHVPMRMDEIIIGDITRLMIGNYKALFIIGCVSSNFPKVYKKEELLLDSEKNYLKNLGFEMSGTNFDKNLSERYLIYSCLNIPKEFLYISYAISNMDGASMSSSIMISKIKQIFPLIEEKSHSIVSREFSLDDISSEKETLNSLFLNFKNEIKINEVILDLYNFYKNNVFYRNYIDLFFENQKSTEYKINLNKNIIEYIYKDSKFSVSSLETYSKCSFKYFIDYIMRIKKRRVYSFEPMDCGNLIHFLMENICEKINKSYDFKNISDENIKEFVDLYFDKNIFCNENLNYVLNTSFKFKTFGNKIKKIVRDSIFFVAKHSSESDFFHKFYEFEIGDKNSKIEIQVSENKKAQFVGKVDRIDFCRAGENILVNIIDYKSSLKTFDYGKIYQNLNIQTIAYMKYVIEIYRNLYKEEIFPCGIFYFTLHSPNIKDKENLDLFSEIQKNYKYEGIFTKNLERLSLVDKNLFKNSSSNILPVKINKDGSFSKNISIDRLLSDEEFNYLLEFVDHSIKFKVREIFKGKISVSPILQNNTSKKCLNCDYLGICKFSRSINSFKTMISLDKDGFFDLVKRRLNCEVEFESE